MGDTRLSQWSYVKLYVFQNETLVDRSALKKVSLFARKMETPRFSERRTINTKLHGVTSHKTICFSTMKNLNRILSQGCGLGIKAPAGPKINTHQTFVYTMPLVADCVCLCVCFFSFGLTFGVSPHFSITFFLPMPLHVPMDFVVSPPGCGRSVTDF
jgi:hypothetical protein